MTFINRYSKSQSLSDLEARVDSMKPDLEASEGFTFNVHSETSSSATQGPGIVNANALNPPGGRDKIILLSPGERK